MTAEAEVGFFSFTEVTDPHEHRSYNEWHQLDHLPEQYQIPGIVRGERWVSTPACTATRAVDPEPTDKLAHVHYMTLYLMSAPIAATLEEFKSFGARLHEAERFHRHRRSRLSGPFRVASAFAAPRVLVAPEVVPFRPGTGIYVVVEQMVDGSSLGEGPDVPDDLSASQAKMLDLPGVAGVWTFSSLAGYEHLGWRPGTRRITVFFLDGPLLEVANSMRALAFEPLAGSVVELAGPFETIVPWKWDWFA